MYLKYVRASNINTAIHTVFWVATSVVVVMGKSAIGSDSLPIFQMLVWIAGIIGARLVLTRMATKKIVIMIDNIRDLLILLYIVYQLVYGDMISVGIGIFVIIISGELFSPVISEWRRYIEDTRYTKPSHKKILVKLRTNYRYTSTIAGAIGSGIALVALTYFKVELQHYGALMLALELLVVMYDMRIYYKYLGKEK